MSDVKKPLARREGLPSVENPKGIFRTTLSYNPSIMMCHFSMKKGAVTPVHTHPAAQNGYVISGRLRMRHGESSFIAEAGCSWAIGSGEPHGAEVLEDSEVIECFCPLRPEYT